MVPAWMGSGESSHPGSRWLFSFASSHDRVQRKSKLSPGSPMGTNPIYKVSILMISSNPNHFPKTQPSFYYHHSGGGVGFQHVNFGGHTNIGPYTYQFPKFSDFLFIFCFLI